jgi:hypothetical protein
MSLVSSTLRSFMPRPKNPKGTALGSVIGSFIPGIGSDLGGQLGNVVADILPSSGGPAREGGGRPDSAPTSEVLTQQNQIPDMRPTMMRGGGTDNIQRDMTFRRSPMYQQANVVTGLFGQAARTLTKPGVQGLIGGTVLGSVVEFFIDEFGNEKKLVITRKMQRDIRELFKLSGGDFATTAFLYEEATGRQLTERQVIKIYTKKFSNQGPYVTKAAVRKMKRTYMKLDTLCDLKDKMCPPKRRAPARRRTTSSQTITQVK